MCTLVTFVERIHKERAHTPIGAQGPKMRLSTTNRATQMIERTRRKGKRTPGERPTLPSPSFARSLRGPTSRYPFSSTHTHAGRSRSTRTPPENDPPVCHRTIICTQRDPIDDTTDDNHKSRAVSIMTYVPRRRRQSVPTTTRLRLGPTQTHTGLIISTLLSSSPHGGHTLFVWNGRTE